MDIDKQVTVTSGRDDDNTDFSPLDESLRLYEEDQILAAGRVLQNSLSLPRDKGGVSHDQLLPVHLRILKHYQIGEELATELKSSVGKGNEEGWIKQGDVSYSTFRTSKYYKLEAKDGKQVIKCRLETPIPSNMVVPLLAVLNESQLYSTWVPHWRVPRLQFPKIEKLAQVGRVSQVVRVVVEPPWPLGTREVVLCARAYDDVEVTGDILVHITSDEHAFEDKVTIPPPDGSNIRIGFEGGFLFRKLPDDHPMATNAEKTKKNDDPDINEDKETILVTCSICVDPKLQLIPQPLLNFATRVGIGTVWNMLLHVAQDVKNGKRQAHENVIKEKRLSLYDYVEERVSVMISWISKGIDSWLAH